MVKRILPILLIVLLLTGCGTGEPVSADEATVAETAGAVQLISLYDADSEVEQQTAGAVRAYPLGDGVYTGLMPMGEKLLVISADGSLTVLQGELGEVAATGISSLSEGWTQNDLVADESGICYYSQKTNEVVLLDVNLQELQRITLPEDIQGKPVIQNSGEVFYCLDSEIRALKINTGVTRLVRQHNCADQELTGSFFDDTVIGCRITDEAGQQRVIYLYAQTGEMVQTDLDGFTMQTDADAYFAILPGDDPQYVYGTLHNEPMCLYPQEGTAVAALLCNGAVGYTATDAGLELAFYDFATGQRTGAVTLQGVGTPETVTSDASYIWLTAEGVLYRWDMNATQTEDKPVCADLRYTPEQPDTAGLAECQSRAQQIRDTYGLNLYIWEEAKDLAEDSVAEEEYRVSVIENSLNQIEALLTQLPADFVKTTGSVSVYLAKSLENGKTLQQYWDSNGCHIVLSSADVSRSFLIGLGFAVDTRVLGNSRDFDTWDDLNPRGFSYTYDYETNAQRDNAEKYLDAFIDLESMSFPTEDRSRIFAYAILPEGAEYFTQDDLQDKLLRLCEGIREAYGLEDSTETFIWEQYLEESLAADE